MRFTGLLDNALDRSVVLGYTKIGSRLRRTWWPADPRPKAMAGKRVVVTGATAGIGEAIARSFAELDATVHLLGRNPDKVRQSAGAIRRAVSGAMVVEEVCDVSDLDAVRAWCEDLPVASKNSTGWFTTPVRCRRSASRRLRVTKPNWLATSWGRTS